ncbi:MAG: hypothetical protein GX557_08295 [Chloroflexi bacterium]|nr:hypothetical protein [Chloroflexota bacterium]
MAKRMTSRERMLAAIHHAEPDRIPVAPWGLGRVGWDSPLGAELVARTDPWIETGMGCNPVQGAVWPVEVERRGNQVRRVLHASGRDLVAVTTTTAQTTASTEYFCKNLADIEALLAVPFVPAAPDLERWAAHKARVGQDGMAIMGMATGLCFPNDMLGTEYCSLLWASEPQIIREMVRVAAERAFVAVEQACQGGVDCIRVVGGEYATELMGPRAWDELVVPFDKPLIEMIHAYGALAHYHNHGRMQRVLEGIADLQMDSLDPVEQVPYGDITMDEALRRVGQRVCLVGGLDDMEVLETRPEAEVRAMAEELLQRNGKRDWMLAGTSSGIYGAAAAHSFTALVDVAERYA